MKGVASVVGGDDEEGELSNVVHIGSLPSIAGGTLWEAIKVCCVYFAFFVVSNVASSDDHVSVWNSASSSNDAKINFCFC